MGVGESTKRFAANPLVPSRAGNFPDSTRLLPILLARLFALAFGTGVRAGTHSRRLRRLKQRLQGNLKMTYVICSVLYLVFVKQRKRKLKTTSNVGRKLKT